MKVVLHLSFHQFYSQVDEWGSGCRSRSRKFCRGGGGGGSELPTLDFNKQNITLGRRGYGVKQVISLCICVVCTSLFLPFFIKVSKHCGRCGSRRGGVHWGFPENRFNLRIKLCSDSHPSRQMRVNIDATLVAIFGIIHHILKK